VRGCGAAGQQKHSVFNEPFAALALNLLIELEPLASSLSGSFFPGSLDDDEDEDERMRTA